jgi:hypothetical protein
MPSITVSPGNLRVLSVDLLQPFRGAWTADLSLDLSDPTTAPANGTPVTVTVQPATGPAAILRGTVDARGSGPFADLYLLRVTAGGAGWDKPVRAQAYDSDGGVTNARVYGGTALEVGENVVVQTPSVLGAHFERSAGPASRVLKGESWWVDPASGATMVGNRPSATPDASMTLIDWDPLTETAKLTCDTLVAPGTVISDARIPNGPITVRDVEQHFDKGGSHITAWCGTSPVTQLANDLLSMVNEMSGAKYLSPKLYRVVLQNSDGRLQLQAVHPTEGFPDTMPIAVYGAAGWSARVTLGCICLVEFLYGDPTQPVVRDFAPALPIESTVDATAIVHVGPSSAHVALAGGSTPLVPTPWASSLTTALTAFATGLNPTTLAANGAALLTALGLLPAPATAKVTAT